MYTLYQSIISHNTNRFFESGIYYYIRHMLLLLSIILGAYYCYLNLYALSCNFGIFYSIFHVKLDCNQAAPILDKLFVHNYNLPKGIITLSLNLKTEILYLKVLQKISEQKSCNKECHCYSVSIVLGHDVLGSLYTEDTYTIHIRM